MWRSHVAKFGTFIAIVLRPAFEGQFNSEEFPSVRETARHLQDINSIRILRYPHGSEIKSDEQNFV